MITCHCNYITDSDIEDVVLSFLKEDPWQLIVPNKVYHELGKRGKCCSCFPSAIDIIIATTTRFHETRACGGSGNLVDLIVRLDGLREQLTAARKRDYVA